MPTPRESRFTNEQLSNARVISSVGRSLGASNRDILIAIMAAFQESGLRNLNYGDRDSVGLFQQRAGWASLNDRMDPVKSARMFFTGGADGQRGLLDFQQRNQWSLTQAAQKVQVSAFPDAYAKHEGKARELLGEIGSTAPSELPVTPNLGATEVDSSLEPSTQESSVLADMGDQIASPVPETGAAPGVESAAAPGIEAANEAPAFSLAMDFLPAQAPPGMPDAETFSSIFPKETDVAGGGRALVLNMAKKLLGTPYVWGGTDPDNGLDCSGYVQYVLRQAGVNLPRISNQQARAGRRVGLKALRPGDLVAWDNSSRNNGADHIAIYMGNGLIAEAPRPGLSVRIRQLGDDEGAWGVSLDY